MSDFCTFGTLTLHCESKSAPNILYWFDWDIASKLLTNFLADWEPDSVSHLASGRWLVKGAEDSFDMLRLYTNSLIYDFDVYLRYSFVLFEVFNNLSFHFYDPFNLELCCIWEKIQKNLLKASFVKSDFRMLFEILRLEKYFEIPIEKGNIDDFHSLFDSSCKVL